MRGRASVAGLLDAAVRDCISSQAFRLSTSRRPSRTGTSTGSSTVMVLPAAAARRANVVRASWTSVDSVSGSAS